MVPGRLVGVMHLSNFATMLVVVIASTSGCLAGKSAASAASTPAPPVALLPRSFPVQEHDLKVTYSVMVASAPVMAGDMQETMWEVSVPAGADNITLRATWTPISPLAATQHCMAHAGTAKGMGTMLGDQKGTSPLTLPATAIPNGTKSLVLMCMGMDEPVAVEVAQPVHLAAAFTRGGKS